VAEKIDFAKVRFLLVDGNRIFLDMVRDVLAIMGATDVRCATDTRKALRYLSEEDIDVVITEWNLEGRTGVDLLDHIRNLPESPNRQLPVVMLTANSDENFVLTARDHGVTEFLAKPFTAQKLFDRLVSVVARPRAFVDAESYFGPDRRRRQVDFDGPDRRQAAH
jgi:CheY-like chemotaxis protein